MCKRNRNEATVLNGSSAGDVQQISVHATVAANRRQFYGALTVVRWMFAARLQHCNVARKLIRSCVKFVFALFCAKLATIGCQQ